LPLASCASTAKTASIELSLMTLMASAGADEMSE
jgi:hypothetical protein